MFKRASAGRTGAWLVAAGSLLAFCLVPSAGAQAQVKPAMVRSVDEPARVPYLATGAPTCGFSNQCLLSGTVVPAGKRLRVTRLQGIFFFTQAFPFFFALNLNNSPLVIFPAESFGAAYYGNVVSFSQEVDYYFEAGQTPVLEVGTSAGNSIFQDSRNKLTIVGYIVDTTP
ncbi:MAG TPA: hypothetical protein VMN79_18870 [Casimicrobiaceae bacterium]|nr:hypothetical protein [Casimicrobiaceae bacterium]